MSCDVERCSELEVPSTRCALLDESSLREGHSSAEGVEDRERTSSSSALGRALRGRGKENFLEPRSRPILPEGRQVSVKRDGGCDPGVEHDS